MCDGVVCGLGVEAIVVGGCCELNTTAHGLIIDIGTQLGIRAATASGEDVNQCVALETTRVRQRIAIEIWSNYQDYICARLKFADPTPDKQRANEDEAVNDAAKQELHAQRYAIQAHPGRLFFSYLGRIRPTSAGSRTNSRGCGGEAPAEKSLFVLIRGPP